MEKIEKRRVLIYARVSTDLQKSVSAQLAELRRYADSQGWEIAGEYVDEGESGAKLSRPGLKGILDACENGGIYAVLVVDQDRLSRLEPLEWEVIKRILRQNNVLLVTPLGTINWDSEDDEFVADLLNLLARRERKKIDRRLCRGHREKALRGEWEGPTPLGYRYDPVSKRLLPDEREAELVRAVFHMYLSGQGCASICRWLAANGVRGKRGGTISPSGLRRILTNEVYVGVRKCSSRLGPVACAGQPALVDEVTFAAVQDTLGRRREDQAARRRPTGVGLLRGILYCGVCGRGLRVAHAQVGTWKAKYYKHMALWRAEGYHLGACRLSRRVDHVDALLVQALEELAHDPGVLVRLVEAAHAPNLLEEARREYKTAQRRLDGLRRQEQRLARLYLLGEWDEEVLAEEQKRIAAERKEHEERYRRAEERLREVQVGQRDLELVAEALAVLRNAGEELSPEELNRLVREVVSQAVLYPDRLEITLRLSGSVVVREWVAAIPVLTR